jgi:hypothetical protein
LTLLFGLFFGAIGSGYMLYGKRQHDGTFLIVGLLLIVFPYFVTHVILTLLVGAALTAVPFVMQRLDW